MNAFAFLSVLWFKTDSSMVISSVTYRGRRTRVEAGVFAAACLCAAAAAWSSAAPAYADEPGDLIIERDITPRIAYDVVPKQDDPVAVRVTTFPKSTFDGMMGGLVSDLDLNGARGSAGVAGSGSGSALAAATTALGIGGSAQQHGGAPMGLAGMGATNMIGTTVSQTITGALAPLTSGLGNLK
jgi:hypothetical protein